MKTKLTLALAACTLSSQAVNISITHHDLTRLSFVVGDRSTPGFASLHDEITQGLSTSIAGISAYDVSAGEFQVSIAWITPALTQNDTFRIPVGHIMFPTFDGASYQLLLDTYEWEWTYLAPVPGEGVPDGGSALIGLGVALVGLWRIKR